MDRPTQDRLGFREIALDYRQPPLVGHAGGTAQAPPLCLAYKEFGAGRTRSELTRAEPRAALLTVYRVVYAIDTPEHSALIRDLDAQMAAWPSDAVEWREPPPAQP